MNVIKAFLYKEFEELVDWLYDPRSEIAMIFSIINIILSIRDTFLLF